MALRSLYSILTALSLTTSLKLCLDAGDSASYGGSGQTVTDRSGTFDFFLGATSSSAADDPTFNGSAGGLSASEYFSFDGGDMLGFSGAITDWPNDLHKSGAKLSIIAGLWYVSLGSSQGICGTSGGASTNIGIMLSVSTAGELQFVCGKSGATAMTTVGSGPTLPSGAEWNIVGVSLDSAGGANSGFLFVNGAFTSFNAAYSSPSASDANQKLGVGSRGGSSFRLAATSRMPFIAIWDGVALTQTNFSAIFNELGLRIGVAPEPRDFIGLLSGISPGSPGVGLSTIEHQRI